jgi:hypothetical protein
MNNLAATRFRLLLITLAVLSITFAAFASWRESGYSPNRSESAESRALLNIAVRSLVALPAGVRSDHVASSFVKGLNQSSAERLLGSLAELDDKIKLLNHVKRLKGLYSIDMDRISAEIKLARQEEKALYGSDFDIALGAILQLKIGTTLSQLTWREDLPESKRGSEYWAKHVARVNDGFLSRKNPWGPLYGNLLVRDAGNENSKTPAALLRISGHQAGYPDGQAHEDVRKKYPGFTLAAEPVISDSMRARLDYDDRRKLVDRKNHVVFGGKNVPAGYDVLLTINPALQELAGNLADNALSGEHIKNASLVAMDLKTGEILAAASAAEGSDGQALVFRTVAPASTSKILFAAAMLEYPDSLKNSRTVLSRLPYYLMISDPQRIFFTTAAFSGAAKPIRDQAARFGWNQDCSQKDEACVGRPMDHLYGSLQKGAVNAPIAGRIMVAETNIKNRFRLLEDAELEQMPDYRTVAPLLEQNAKRPAHIRKDDFDAAKVVRMSMFGQGDVRTSTFGLLQTISHLAVAANGGKEVTLPHIVSAVLNAEGKAVQIPLPVAVPVGMKPENARLLAGYLAAVNSRGGTAAEPFRKVFERELSDQELLFAKTGTTDSAVKGSVPLYLYLAAYSRNGKEYDTAVVAICERKIQQGRNYNYAAELALRFIKATKAAHRG